MIYKKIKAKNYNIHVIKTDKYKTISLKLNFKRELKKEEVTIRNLLINTMLTSCLKYPSKRQMEIETEELYGLSYRGFNNASGVFSIMSFEITFLDEKYTMKGMNKKSLDFLHDIIFNPNVKNDEFIEDGFKIAYNSLKDELTSLKENSSLYSQLKLLELMNDEYISICNIGYLNDLEKINPINLYKYYLDVLNNDIVDIFVVGNIDDDFIKNIESVFKFKENKISNKSHYYYPTKYHEKYIKSIEEDNIKQSKLVLGLKMMDVTNFELVYVSYIFNYILGGGPDSKLFRVVREKESLCYSISSSSYPLYSLMVIRAGIDSRKYLKTLDLILKELNNIILGKFSLNDINNGILAYINGLQELKESPEGLIALYQGKDYLNSDSINTKKRKIKMVTKKDVIAFAKKVKLDAVYLLKGTLDENI